MDYATLQTLNFYSWPEGFIPWLINLARELKRAVRQGDPLSPYLFLLAVETLAIAIRANEEIKRIVINQEETKLLQYADDTTAVLADLESAQKLFQLLDKFKELSGLMVSSNTSWKILEV